jgi:hypothetical protein
LRRLLGATLVEMQEAQTEAKAASQMATNWTDPRPAEESRTMMAGLAWQRQALV